MQLLKPNGDPTDSINEAAWIVNDSVCKGHGANVPATIPAGTFTSILFTDYRGTNYVWDGSSWDQL